ncbi:MAG: hypothetical protein ACRDXX_00605 [Stackebrandtia sp.]
MDELPSWIPRELVQIARLTGESEVTLDARQPRAGIAFDRVPDGWRIIVRWPGKHALAEVDVAQPGRDIEWRFQNVGDQPVTIGAKVRSVHVTTTARQVNLVLVGNGTNLHLESNGTYQVDGSPGQGSAVAYRAWACVEGAQITLCGSAALSQLRGTGSVTLRGRDLGPMAKLEFSGDLHVEGAVEAETVDLGAEGKLKCFGLKADTVIADAVEVASPPSHTAMEIRDRLEARCLHVDGLVRGAATPDVSTEFVVAETLQVQHLTDVLVTGAADSARRLNATVTGTATRCVFAGRTGTVKLGKLDVSLAIEDAESVAVAGDGVGDIQVRAESVEFGTLNGRGEITAGSIKVRGDVTGCDGAIVAAARQHLHVGGKVRSAVLRSQATSTSPAISIGHARTVHGRAPLPSAQESQPELSEDYVVPAERDPSRPQTELGYSVTGCIVNAAGDVKVVGDVETSVIEAGGRVTVDGDADFTGLDTAEGLAEASPRQDGEHGEAVALQSPCVAEEVVVLGDLRLRHDQLVTASHTVSVEAMQNGRIDVTVDDGVFVARRVESCQVSAGSIGVVESPTEATLQATKLLHLQAGAQTGNSLTCRGDFVSSGEIKSVLHWDAEPGRWCRLLKGADDVHVAGPMEANREDPPELRLGADQMLQRLQLRGGLRLVVADSKSQGKRRKAWLEPDGPEPHPVPTTRTITLEECAHLKVCPGRYYLGEVTIEGPASITHEGEADSNLVLALRPLSMDNGEASKPVLTLTPASRVWIGASKENHEDPTIGAMPTVRIAEGTLVVAANLDDVSCGNEDGPGKGTPKLHVRKIGSIASLRGRFCLAELRGRVTASRHRPSWLCRVLKLKDGVVDKQAQVMAVTAAEHPETARGKPSSPNRQPYPDLADGELIGADVTRLDYIGIRALSHLHVFDPDGKTLIRHFRKDKPRSKAERAQRLKLLAETVSDKAASGASRSATMWAAARAHHASIKRTRLEWWLRWLHFFVGYGYRPLPALISYGVALTLTTAILTVADSDPQCTDLAGARTFADASNPWDQFLRVLLLPAGLLRLDFGGAAGYAPVGCHAAWHVLALAVTGYFLVYLLLAVRNYLRTPADHR